MEIFLVGWYRGNAGEIWSDAEESTIDRKRLLKHENFCLKIFQQCWLSDRGRGTHPIIFNMW